MLITSFEFDTPEQYNQWKINNSSNSDSFQFVTVTPPERFPAKLKLFPDNKNPNVWGNFVWSYPSEDQSFFSPY
jgi:hypothetical protein